MAHWKAGDATLPVQYNPTEIALEKKLQFAEITIPGLSGPLHQFVRGQAETLTIELFFDTSDQGMGAQAVSVATETDKIYSLARIEPEGHAPPTISIFWGAGFPGSQLAANLDGGTRVNGQRRNSFTGVITGIRQTFTLWSVGGMPLRARLTLTIAEFKTLKEQLDELNLSSPDRTHGHVLTSSDQLWSVAQRYYSRPGEWRRVAEGNGIADPRRLTPGLRLAVPAITAGRAVR
ncbi:CIS tube protein [Falsiroseomonas sp. E2-1-a4]|uniref:CIS tube protein n=1 Tax=Falsiroseomonas sp. E2-1-a4 TaxID=3239299 RepID=UPI003F3A464B